MGYKCHFHYSEAGGGNFEILVKKEVEEKEVIDMAEEELAEK